MYNHVLILHDGKQKPQARGEYCLLALSLTWFEGIELSHVIEGEVYV